MIPTTRAQRVALFKVFQRDFPNWKSPGKRLDIRKKRVIRVSTYQWRHFRKQIQPLYDGSGCIMIPWHGMMLGIEKDGYTHS